MTAFSSPGSGSTIACPLEKPAPNRPGLLTMMLPFRKIIVFRLLKTIIVLPDHEFRDHYVLKATR